MEDAPSPDNSARYAKKAGDTEIAKNILSSTVPRGRIIAPMTRARTASYGVVTPPPLDRWIEAVLMLCVSLVHRAATTLGMILNRTSRDWHMDDAHEDLPQATFGTSSQGPNTPTESCLGLSQASLLAQRGDSQSIPATPSTGMLATRASMTPLMLRHTEWKRTSWSAFPA
jgi:hypothetical protein